MENMTEEPLNAKTTPSRSSSSMSCFGNLFNLCLVIFCAVPAGLCGILCYFTILLNNFILPVAELVVGSVYFDKEFCPKENIAVILILGGCIGIISGVLSCMDRGIQQQRAQDAATAESGGQTVTVSTETPLFIRMTSTILQISGLIWTIVAAVVVFRFYGDVSYDESDPSYCHPLLYRLLFWVVILCIVLIPLVLCCNCVASYGARGGAAAQQRGNN